MTLKNSLDYLVQTCKQWELAESRRRHKAPDFHFHCFQGYDYKTPDWMTKETDWSLHQSYVGIGTLSGHDTFKIEDLKDQCLTAAKAFTSHWQSNPLLWPLSITLSLTSHKTSFKLCLTLGGLRVRDTDAKGGSLSNMLKALQSTIDISEKIWKTGNGEVDAWSFEGERAILLARSAEEALLMREAILHPHQFFPYKDRISYQNPYRCVSPHIEATTKARHALLSP